MARDPLVAKHLRDRVAFLRYVMTSSRGATSKYRARAVTVDGIRFDSLKEAARYRELVILARAGAIDALECHPKYPITVVELFRGDREHVTTCGTYTADFRYVERATGELVVEDTKSGPTKTTAYRLRKRLVEAIHGITIREV